LRLFAVFLVFGLLAGSALAQPVNEADAEQGWLHRLDRFHDWFFTNADSYVTRADQMFAGPDGPVQRVTNSTFSAEFYVEFKHDHEIEFELSPSFSADVYVPNLERRLNIYINNIAQDELPGADPMKRKDQTHVGASSKFDFWDVIDLKLSSGVKWRWPPVVYTDAEWSKAWNTTDEKWHWRPSAKGFWYSDDGFGSKADMRVEYWPTRLSLIAWSGGARWSETTDGVEWSQAIGMGVVLSGTREKAEHVLGTRFVCGGHKSGTGVMDSYRYEVIYRRPLYKEWIFFSLTPKLQWDNDNNWNTVPSIMCGIDMYFTSLLGD
jgi:hypothetical protein